MARRKGLASADGVVVRTGAAALAVWQAVRVRGALAGPLPTTRATRGRAQGRVRGAADETRQPLLPGVPGGAGAHFPVTVWAARAPTLTDAAVESMGVPG